jgi:hypothetical protein
MSEENKAKLRELQAQRDRLADAAADNADARKVEDLPHVIDAETKFGKDRVKVIKVIHFTFSQPEIPMCVVVRTPREAEMKRYRDGCTASEDTPGDPASAAELLGEACLVYPDRETFAKLRGQFPGGAVRAGVEAAKLGMGVEVLAGKG